MKQLKVVLKENGYRVVDLHEIICKKYLVEYNKLTRYCRSVNKGCWSDKRLAKAIEDALEEMNVKWI